VSFRLWLRIVTSLRLHLFRDLYRTFRDSLQPPLYAPTRHDKARNVFPRWEQELTDIYVKRGLNRCLAREVAVELTEKVCSSRHS
jgi:hypothetical protein